MDKQTSLLLPYRQFRNRARSAVSSISLPISHHTLQVEIKNIHKHTASPESNHVESVSASVKTGQLDLKKDYGETKPRPSCVPKQQIYIYIYKYILFRFESEYPCRMHQLLLFLQKTADWGPIVLCSRSKSLCHKELPFRVSAYIKILSKPGSFPMTPKIQVQHTGEQQYFS